MHIGIDARIDASTFAMHIGLIAVLLTLLSTQTTAQGTNYGWCFNDRNCLGQGNRVLGNGEPKAVGNCFSFVASHFHRWACRSTDGNSQCESAFPGRCIGGAESYLLIKAG
ncbi:unnamed protein product [Jaminaea pallidilutea]